MKTQRVPKMPVAEIYISGTELARVVQMVTNEKIKFKDGGNGSNWEVKVKGNMGYHHLIPILKSITNYLERRKLYDEKQPKDCGCDNCTCK